MLHKTFSLALNVRFFRTSLLLALKSKITLQLEGRLRGDININYPITSLLVPGILLVHYYFIEISHTIYMAVEN